MIYIFDIDGTLTDKNDTILYSHASNWFSTQLQPNDKIYLATNQGGVGLRYWMNVQQWGEPEKYPTQEYVVERITSIAAKIAYIAQRGEVTPFISFAYQSKNGNWNPLPGRAYFEMEHEKPYYKLRNFRGEWCRSWRKPYPGMLQVIYQEGIQRFNVRSWSDYLVIGDMETDRQAAESANLPFCFANEFFKGE